jgi:hypothetical protein
MKTHFPGPQAFVPGNGSDRSSKTFISPFLADFGTVSALLSVSAKLISGSSKAIPPHYFPHPDHPTLHDSTLCAVDLPINKNQNIQSGSVTGSELILPPGSAFLEYSPEGNYRGPVNQNNRQAIQPGKTAFTIRGNLTDLG